MEDFRGGGGRGAAAPFKGGDKGAAEREGRQPHTPHVSATGSRGQTVYAPKFLNVVVKHIDATHSQSEKICWICQLYTQTRHPLYICKLV